MAGADGSALSDGPEPVTGAAVEAASGAAAVTAAKAASGAAVTAAEAAVVTAAEAAVVTAAEAAVVTAAVTASEAAERAEEAGVDDEDAVDGPEPGPEAAPRTRKAPPPAPYGGLRVRASGA
ncbi:hypothetical protein ACWEWQ_10485, partial [Streptomyces sp. NPDC003832]